MKKTPQIMDFGNFIKKEREKKFWTQTELGAMIGINASAISRIENGSKKFSVSKIKLLSDIFEQDVQLINDLFFADKFAREADKYKCSENVFAVAHGTALYLKNINTKQKEINFSNE
ncbi:helix-turn-helix transcriptional regulator [Chryseobacterium sp. CFBP8996]|uniref:helix-turn-helix domain-containing protein n=1 Tax=Chryseobacterium sp. CFBP8996 TaxID=3096529 RepID=UPI002A6A0607|nr:helix-turn-helix transcriptional regulator [Chryseobacterium sp. CFBP8996]MDY0930739.1 helix-turn-helix transcriptional regulator [Chryseobacterium sp. CFBP8996]